jgi:hypothetical protein
VPSAQPTSASGYLAHTCGVETPQEEGSDSEVVQGLVGCVLNVNIMTSGVADAGSSASKDGPVAALLIDLREGSPAR